MNLAQRILARDRRRKQQERAREIVGADVRELDDPGPLLAFVPKLTPKFRKPTHLVKLSDAIERGTAVPGSVHEAFSYPVRHGKTSLIHHAIPWMLRKDPTRKILYGSYAFGFAKKQTAKAKALTRKAGVALTRGRRGDYWETKAGGFVMASGVGGQLAGEGFTDVFFDDPHKNRAEAESRVIREGVIEAFFNDVFTRQEPGGTNFYVVHARWHINDLIGVLSKMKDGAFPYHNAPALDRNGKALAPWLFTAKKLRAIEAILGPYVFASLYNGSPRRRGGNLFHEPTLAKLVEPDSYRIAIGIDLIRKTTDRSDWNAAVVMRKDLDRDRLDVLHAVRERGGLVDRRHGDDLVDAGFVRELVKLLHMYPTAELCMYATETEMGFVRLLEVMLRELMGYDVAIAVMPIGGDKYLRAQAYAASWNLNRVRIAGRTSVKEEDESEPDRHGWQGPFVVEHVEFTGQKGGIDDQVDAGAAAHDHLMVDQETSLEEAMAAIGRI